MDKNIEINLELLIGILDKKIDVMNEIYNIVINQKTMLQSGTDCMDMLRETGNMVKEKTLLINGLDSDFQNKYDMISKDLSACKEDYKGYIILLKDKIKTCTELKLKIKLQEEKNKALLDK
ncbi:MAG: hypothetical protein MJ245_01960 [Clostridia bacterium]|nr:hypothetical protein [Clostridia bacterium]